MVMRTQHNTAPKNLHFNFAINTTKGLQGTQLICKRAIIGAAFDRLSYVRRNHVMRNIVARYCVYDIKLYYTWIGTFWLNAWMDCLTS